MKFFHTSSFTHYGEQSGKTITLSVDVDDETEDIKENIYKYRCLVLSHLEPRWVSSNGSQ